MRRARHGKNVEAFLNLYCFRRDGELKKAYRVNKYKDKK